MNRRLGSRIRLFISKEWKPILVLLGGLAGTISIAYFSFLTTQKEAHREFSLECKEVEARIITRLKAHAELLRLGAAFFSEFDTVTREAWKGFFEKSKIDRNLPGIQGFGVSIVIPKKQLAAHIKKIQSEGFPKYNVHPQGDREIYTSIIYLEPFKDRNLRAFGYDMLSEKIRRKAMEYARDFDYASLSGKVKLVQETNKDVQAGTLMYVPVYKKGKPVITIQQRREALVSWVYSPYRMDNVMEGILGKWGEKGNAQIRLQIFDDASLDPDALLFDSQKKLEIPKDYDRIVDNVNFNGKTWTLCFFKPNSLELSFNNKIVIIILCGFLISLLLFLLTRNLIYTKNKAHELAAKLTTDLKNSEERWKFAVDGAGDGLWDWNMETNEVYYSTQWKKMFGYQEHEIGATLKDWENRVHPEDLSNCYHDVQLHIEGKTPFYSNTHRILCKDGTYKWILDRGKIVNYDKDGKPLRIIGTHSDLSERLKTEEALRESEAKSLAILRTLPDMMLIQDREGIYLDFYIPKNIFTNSPQKVFKGQRIENVLPPELATEFLEVFKNTIETRKLLMLEYSLVLPCGERFFEARSIAFEQNKILTIVRDITERKLAIDTLRKNEIHFLLSFNMARLGHWEYDVEKDLFYFNDSFYNIFNDNVQQVGSYTLTPAQYASRYVHPDDIHLFAEEIQNALVTTDPYYNRYIEHRFFYCDKKVGFLAVRFQVTKNEKGKTIKIYGVNQDITKQKRTEGSIRLRESYMAAIIENQPGLVWLKDRESRFLAVNDAFAKAAGVTNKESIIGKTDWEIWPHELASVYVSDDQKVMDSLESVMIEELIAENGKNIWFETFKTPIIGDDGIVIGTTGYSRDITERKTAEEEIRQISTRLSLAAKAGGVGVWDWDVVNNLLIWDDQMYALYGIQKSAFSGAYDAWVSGLHPQDKDRGDLEIKLALKGEKDFDSEFRVIWPDGSIHNIRALAIVQRDQTGQALHMIGTNWDITEQKQNEAALIKSKLEAEMANRAKSEFLANMSHEIRTPMNAILGFSEALYHKLESKQHQKMVKSILNGGNLLMSLLNDILDLSKIEAGKLDISPGPVNLPNLLVEILQLFEEKAKTKEIDFHHHISPHFPSGIMLDEIRIKQVLFNLIGNAIKFTHTGYVKINLNYTPSSETFGRLVIEVEDTGIGIPESQYQFIFEAFRQQQGQSNREYGGTGLGLAISKRLVEKMKGYIELQSHVGEGSTFSIIFPEIESCVLKIREIEPSKELEKMEFETSSILVIDDVYSNIEAIENFLTTTKVSVLSAENGELGLEILKHTIPDVILLDMRMPGMNGYELAHQIKSSSKYKKIPLLAYTASIISSKKIEDSGIFDGYLYKPVRRAELFNQLRKFIRHKTVKAIIKNEKVENQLSIIEGLKSDNIPIVYSLLNDKLLTEWKKIKDTLILFKITEFAEELHTLSVDFNFIYLKKYAEKLKENIEAIEIEVIKEELLNFPTIIEKLRNYC